MDKPTDAPEVLETPETQEPETPAEPVTAPEEPELTKEEIAELKAKAAKADDLEGKNKQLFERLQKAKTAAPTSNIDPLDAVALAKSNVAEEDIDEVIEFAKFKKVSVRDALKDKTLQRIIADNVETRRTANATLTKGGARGAAEVSGEDLLAKAERGDEVDLSDDNARKIFKTRIARKLGKK